MNGESSSGVALGELVAALSLATDLGLGLPQEHVLRQTLIAQRIGRAAGFDAERQSAVFYVSLLAWVGCVADSYELAKWFGDDIGMRANSYQIDKRGLAMMRFLLTNVGAGSAPLRRVTVMGKFVVEGMKDAATSMVTHCQTTGVLAGRLGLPDEVNSALRQSFERWDGKGVPSGLHGTEIDSVMRVVQLADDTEAFVHRGGPEAAVEMLRSRRGTEFDPALVDLVCANSESLLGDLDDLDVWDEVI